MTQNCLIVIVSAYQQYAIGAIELEVFRYLVKDQLDANFDRCMEAAEKRLRSKAADYYIISSDRKKEKIFCSDIIYCDKDGKMSILHTRRGEVRERKTLQTLLNDLQKICNYFIIIERGYIVNMNCVTNIVKNNIILEQDLVLPIGVTYLADVRKKMNEFWRNQL